MSGSSKPKDVQHAKELQLKDRLDAVRKKLADSDKTIEELIPITELSLTELRDRLGKETLTTSTVLNAFQARTLQLHDLGNSGLCEFIREADDQAVKLKAPQSIDSELYGIPVSIKELCCVKGYDATFGLWNQCLKPSTEDCVIIKVLREAGAIPFALTATSQLAMTTSGYNPVFGSMHNPHSDNHEPGGSSSGEGVLIQQHGSPIGIGTDIAGSIRIPSAFCGLCGLKPTVSRISGRGMAHILFESVIEFNVVAGPMGRCVEDLAKVMRTLLCPTMFRLDPTVPVMPFKEEIYSGRTQETLTIGYYDTMAHSDVVQTVPSVRRAVEKARSILTRSGHRLVPFNPPKPQKALQLALGAISIDGGNKARQLLANEPLNEHTKQIKQLAQLPNAFRPVVDAGVKKFIGSPSALAQHVRKRASVKELMDFVEKIRRYREKFADAWINETQLDAVICPVWACPAPTRDVDPLYNNPCVAYTILYNLVDYPAGVVPMGSVQDEDISKALEEAVAAKQRNDGFHEKFMQTQSSTKGLPLSVQVVARPWREEMVLRVMHELEAGVQFET